MRSIVVVFAVALGACAPFGTDHVSPGVEDTDAPVVKKKPSGDVEPVLNQDDDPAPPATPTPASSDLAQFPGSRLFKPAQTPAPAIVVLHGSEGGSDPAYQTFAQDLATRGFVVVAMCWFGCGGRPAALDRIPLESIADVGQYLKTSPYANGKVGLFGWGRGAEAALALTAKAGIDPFAAVAVYGSTDVIVATDSAGEAWTWNREAIANGARIPVETYLGPVFLAHGEMDTVAPLEGAENIAAARMLIRSPLVTDTKLFPDEGHTLSKPEDETKLRDFVADFLQARLGAMP